jgi:hypothetical protein
MGLRGKGGSVSAQRRECFSAKAGVFQRKGGSVSAQRRECFSAKAGVFQRNLLNSQLLAKLNFFLDLFSYS